MQPKPKEKIRILIADDHSVVRHGLVALLNYESDLVVVGEAADGPSAVTRAAETTPDVAIVDLMMPGMDGVATTQAIRTATPATRVLILTSFHASGDIARAVAAGAVGVVAKHRTDEELIAAIHAVADGGTAFPPEIVCHREPTTLSTANFTRRQLDILSFAARGFSNAEIGRLFGISKDMVKAHMKVILKKIGAANRTEAVSLALQEGILPF